MVFRHPQPPQHPQHPQTGQMRNSGCSTFASAGLFDQYTRLFSVGCGAALVVMCQRLLKDKDEEDEAVE
ncbi:hypothetical protein V495_02245 [Pseudogymnoascus sp. VKM F-4514 (FW-929)]|nr:hypothetical protein V490_03873 [Pseudogymnoascus sp. VKM F-3557]KFY46813.1 hypothetical protein V495_02245 [Pseudogymnoascus sp. VKM F-4514 (FW-929)]KFY60732.1 hypothetical protein V497_03409 [Pseudogymnoascus sp. VKM F-4516 (FW-969)]